MLQESWITLARVLYNSCKTLRGSWKKLASILGNFCKNLRGIRMALAGLVAAGPIFHQGGQVYSTKDDLPTNITPKRGSLFNRKSSVQVIAHVHCVKSIISVSNSSWAGATVKLSLVIIWRTFEGPPSWSMTPAQLIGIMLYYVKFGQPDQ